MRILLCDHTGVFKAGGELDLLSAVQTEALGEVTKLTATVAGAPNIVRNDRLVYTDRRGTAHCMTVTSPSVEHTDAGPITTIVAKDALSLLTGRVHGRAWVNHSLPWIVKDCLNDSAFWTPGTLAETGVKWFDLSFKSDYAIFKELAASYNVEFWAEYTIDPHATSKPVTAARINAGHRGDSSAVAWRFDAGYDVTGVTRTVNDTEIWTGAIGLGKTTKAADEKNHVPAERVSCSYQDNAAVAKWGQMITVYENTNQGDAKALLSEVKAYVNKHKTPDVTYEITGVAYSETGLSNLVGIGDTVQISDPELSLRAEGRVSKLEDDLVNPANSTITIGTATETLAKHASNALKGAATDVQRVTEAIGDWGSGNGTIAGNAAAWNAAAALTPYVRVGADGQLELVQDGKTYVFNPNSGAFVARDENKEA